MSAQTKLPPSTASPPDRNIDIDTVIYSFLEAFPEPTDDQVHQLAFILDLDFEDFEEKIFELFSQDVEELGPDEVLSPGEQDDPLDLFLIAYFLRNPRTSGEQIHALASLVGLTPEALEERVYSLMSDLNRDDEDDAVTTFDIFPRRSATCNEELADLDLEDLDDDDELSGLDLEDIDDEDSESDSDSELDDLDGDEDDTDPGD